MTNTHTNLNPFGLYCQRDGAWRFVLSFENAAAASRSLASRTEGLGQFSPPADEWAQDLIDGFCVQASDRIGTRYALIAMPFPATVSSCSTMALAFGFVRTEDDEPLEGLI